MINITSTTFITYRFINRYVISIISIQRNGKPSRRDREAKRRGDDRMARLGMPHQFDG